MAVQNAINLVFTDSEDSDSDVGDMEVIPFAKKYKPRVDFNYSCGFEFKEKFRISPTTAEFILEKIGANLQHQTERSNALSPMQQVLIALRFLGTGSQYHAVGSTHGISKSSVHRCIKRVSQAICTILFAEEVRWPTTDTLAIATQFMKFKQFPRIAGCVDGSLIPIDAPKKNEAAYVDRHGNHSINAMVVCGPNLEFFYASAKWPGSVHDARALRNSSLEMHWSNGYRPFPGAVILGDSGYPLKSWLIPPTVDGVMNQEKTRFLRAHKGTRRLVECALGVLKEKFPCLNHLRLQPEVAARVIYTCIVAHNLEKRLGTTVYEEYEEDDEDELEFRKMLDEEMENGDVIDTFISYFG